MFDALKNLFEYFSSKNKDYVYKTYLLINGWIVLTMLDLYTSYRLFYDTANMKRILLQAISLFLSFSAYSQSIKSLSTVGAGDIISNEQCVIYGNCIQRLGFSSGGYPQDIRIMNTDTKEIFSYRVNPTFKSTKENQFTYFLKPGKYIIVNYWWTQSKVYGGTMYAEPIFKGIDATNKFEEKIKSGELKEKDLTSFSFIITENTLNYLGTWHFDKGLVSFTDDKTSLDENSLKSSKNLISQIVKLQYPIKTTYKNRYKLSLRGSETTKI